MAKILFTAVVADMRNKLNGTVFSKNRYGAYTRTKVTPVNPQSTAQMLVRSRFGASSAAWRSLTEAQRQSWIDGAPGFPISDIFGNSKILSGQALYNRLNLNLAQVGTASISTCPSPGSVGETVLDSITADVSDNEIVLSSATAAVPAGFKCAVMGTPLYSPGISFVKNKYRFLGAIAAAGTLNTANVGDEWNAVFGSLVAGQKLSIGLFLVNTTTGQAAPMSTATTIVVA